MDTKAGGPEENTTLLGHAGFCPATIFLGVFNRLVGLEEWRFESTIRYDYNDYNLEFSQSLTFWGPQQCAT